MVVICYACTRTIYIKKGIINIGGKIQSVYDFAKKTKKDVIRSSGKKIFPPNPSMNISKLKKILS